MLHTIAEGMSKRSVESRSLDNAASNSRLKERMPLLSSVNQRACCRQLHLSSPCKCSLQRGIMCHFHFITTNVRPCVFSLTAEWVIGLKECSKHAPTISLSGKCTHLKTREFPIHSAYLAEFLIPSLARLHSCSFVMLLNKPVIFCLGVEVNVGHGTDA